MAWNREHELRLTLPCPFENQWEEIGEGSHKLKQGELRWDAHSLTCIYTHLRAHDLSAGWSIMRKLVCRDTECQRWLSQSAIDGIRTLINVSYRIFLLNLSEAQSIVVNVRIVGIWALSCKWESAGKKAGETHGQDYYVCLLYIYILWGTPSNHTRAICSQH